MAKPIAFGIVHYSSTQMQLQLNLVEGKQEIK